MSERQKVVALMEAAHRIQWVTKPIFTPKIRDVERYPLFYPEGVEYLRDAGRHLGTAGGCGSFSLVLAKTLEAAGFEYRLAQMVCNGTDAACHILVEAKVNEKWVVLDPLFNQTFTTPEGELASFDEVGSDWDTYKLQVPQWRRTAPPASEQHYPTDFYDYGGVRYTNWQKVPVLMPAVYSALKGLLGEQQASHISLRTYVLDINRVHLWESVFVLFLGVSLLVARLRALSGKRGLSTKERERPDLPEADSAE